MRLTKDRVCNRIVASRVEFGRIRKLPRANYTRNSYTPSSGVGNDKRHRESYGILKAGSRTSVEIIIMTDSFLLTFYGINRSRGSILMKIFN